MLHPWFVARVHIGLASNILNCDVMSWIDDDANERIRRASNKQLILDQAEDTFNRLWEEVKLSLQDAQKREEFSQLITNGSPLERKVILPQTPTFANRTREPKVLVLKLEKDKLGITVDDLKSSIRLRFDVCDDNVVCLSHEGTRVSMQEAAKIALRPFLFPELV